MKKIGLFFLVPFAMTSGAHAQWLWNVKKMDTIKSHLTSFTYAPAYNALLTQADQELGHSLYSVMQKKDIAPSGDKHDYVSLSRYWWPDPKSPNGLPYINKDGEVNPELNRYDRNTLGDMCAAVNTLSLAYFYSGQEKYAQKAVKVLSAWFLDAKTRMNPNLEYSQFVPGRDNSKGRSEGLIDSYSFVEMVNSVQLLKGSASYTAQDERALKKWFSDFVKWMDSSVQGKKENAAKNNHGTAFDAQAIAYLLFSGNETAAKKLIQEFPEKRMFTQIEPDGKQPNELWRTLAYHYSEYNLTHILDVCATAQKLGIDLLHMTSPDGGSVFKATDYLASFLGKKVESWPYKQISGWDAKQQDVCDDMVRILDMDATKTMYRPLINQYATQDLTNRKRLLFGAENPIAEVFSFAATQFDYALGRIDSVRAHSSKKDVVSPRSIDKKGQMVLVAPRDWCSGFFPGSLWRMYQYTQDNKWKTVADQYTRKLEVEKNDRSSHDVGFKVYCSYGNGYEDTKDTVYKNVVIQAASTLSTRFNDRIGVIRSWDFNKETWQYPVIIDNMMNLELLFEAAKLSGNKRFYEIADKHATTTLHNHFRPDYSSYHVVDYDTTTGKARRKMTFQGYADSSAWARGQSWALYGFTMCYRYTKNPAYLKQAEGVAGFIFNNKNLPSDLIPYWDYNDPTIPNAPRDASAACVTASALYELAQYDKKDSAHYTQLANTILANLIAHYRAKPNADEGFLLLHSTGHHPANSEIDVPISYADYYFLQALLQRNALDNQ